jgi:hypothetical protein
MRKSIFVFLAGLFLCAPLLAQTTPYKKFSFASSSQYSLETVARETAKESRPWAGNQDGSDAARSILRRDTFVTTMSTRELGSHMDWVFAQDNNNRADFFPFPFIAKESSDENVQFIGAATASHAVIAFRVKWK